MANIPQTISNMVQGVSQQAAQERRNTQCEAQFDCLNQPVEGCVARPGLEFVRKLDAGDWTDAFWYDIMRSNTERYSVAIKAGSMKAWNFAAAGVNCTIAPTESVAAYLTAMSGGLKDWNNWAATSSNDVTFLGNKQIAPQMASTRSDARPPEALFWFRAGGYKVTYQIGIKYLGTWYNWSYQTPDNSVAGNAQYITTDAICYALYNAMVTDPTHPIGATGTGHLGFSIQREGNIMRLWRTDNVEFDILTSDGLNNTQLTGLKDRVGGLDDIPQNGFHGMLFKVAGAADDENSDDWFIQFDSTAQAHDSSTQGSWVETVAPDTQTDLNRTTMPLLLVNDAINHFNLSYGIWGSRLAGDGVDSARDPSFTGHKFQDIFYDQARFAVMTEFSTVWSRVRNPYVFLPDTVQAGLASAPIDAVIEQTKGVAILKRPVQTNGTTYLWAEGQQLSVTHGSTTSFSNASIEVKPTSAYAWNETIEPKTLGSSVIFATSDDKWTTLTEATFDEAKVVDETGISDHVPNYVPADVRILTGSDTAKKLFVYADSTANLLYLYEYRKGQNERLQSSWQTWRLPPLSHIVHAVLDKTILYVWVSRPDGLFLFKCSVSPNQSDAEGTYLTRMDFRVKESDCTVSYNSGTKQTSIVLPYKANDVLPFLEAGQDNLLMAIRDTTAGFIRGKGVTIASVSTVGSVTTVKVDGDYHLAHFYLGFRIRAERQESTFYRRDDQTGYTYLERIQLLRGVLLIHDTAYTRVEVVANNGNIRRVYEEEGRNLGDIANVLDAVVTRTGSISYGIGEANEEATIRYVNDSFLPSAWQGETFIYNPTVRTQLGA